ncbi:MAG: hypothetical protein ACJAU9_000342 [Lentimonas sp.]|jgi:hypothetical protein
MMPLGAAEVIAQISPIFSEKNGGRVPSVHFITETAPFLQSHKRRPGISQDYPGPYLELF